ncbi:NUDIX domain-containing protein [Photobacterium makurazakiensis]|uniref:NUDIX hydrolase n=1 Tax=Photobacterium makurazakiensis TaxID=2910234 RepID=UPI003D1342B4
MNYEIDKLAWLYIKDNRVLMARSKGKDKFYLPGGKREEGESDESALIREIKEEISIDIIPETIEYMDVFTAQADGKSSDTLVRLTCYRADFQGECKPSAEIEEIDWICYQEKERCSLAAKVVLDTLKSQHILD